MCIINAHFKEYVSYLRNLLTDFHDFFGKFYRIESIQFFMCLTNNVNYYIIGHSSIKLYSITGDRDGVLRLPAEADPPIHLSQS